jgi:hypothetical protein
MNDGVALLLERMKTNPEEFVIEEGVPAKWDSLIRSYESVLPPEDVKSFKEARNALLQQQFTEKVLEELVDPKKSSLEELLLIAKRNATPSGGTTPIPYTVSSDGTLTSWENREPLSITLTKTPKKPKEHKTLFGRLFNYS